MIFLRAWQIAQRSRSGTLFPFDQIMLEQRRRESPAYRQKWYRIDPNQKLVKWRHRACGQQPYRWDHCVSIAYGEEWLTEMGKMSWQAWRDSVPFFVSVVLRRWGVLKAVTFLPQLEDSSSVTNARPAAGPDAQRPPCWRHRRHRPVPSSAR